MADDTIKVAKKTRGACAGYTWTKPDQVVEVDIDTATAILYIKDADFYEAGEDAKVDVPLPKPKLGTKIKED
jgi:hypothetical protein